MKHTLVTALLWVSQDSGLHKYVAFALVHVTHQPTSSRLSPQELTPSAHGETPPRHCAFMPPPVQTRCVPRDVLPWLFSGLCQRAAWMGSGHCSGSGPPAICAVPGQGTHTF